MKIYYNPEVRNSYNFIANPQNKTSIKCENECGDKLLDTPQSIYNRIKIISFGQKMVNKDESNSKYSLNSFAGCLVGGAIGDALGAPVEFMKLKKIKTLYGENGITYITQDKKGRIGFTDDTQLTMFTADGVIKSALKHFNAKQQPDYNMIFSSYQDWYKTCAQAQRVNHGWISELDDLLSTGGSGKTCMNTLSQDKMGSVEKPINNSKGTGGIMRVAPIGLLYHRYPENAFDIAVNCAALTHGNPNAYLSAGVYSAIIANIINGEPLETAIDHSIEILKTKPDSKELIDIVDKAKELASNADIAPIDAINQLGKGWNGDEALAIAIYCALKTPDDFRQVIVNASNHDGDSDTVASIAGGISGAYLGYNNLPKDLISSLPMENVLFELANDLFQCPRNIQSAKQRYNME